MVWFNICHFTTVSLHTDKLWVWSPISVMPWPSPSRGHRTCNWDTPTPLTKCHLMSREGNWLDVAQTFVSEWCIHYSCNLWYFLWKSDTNQWVKMINSSYSSCFLSSKVELLPVIKPLSFTVHCYVFHTVTLLPTHITADNNVANRSLLVYLFFCVCVKWRKGRWRSG